MNKIKLKIEGMHCTSCAFNIDGELEDLKGVKSSTTSFAKHMTEVEFDDKVTDIIMLQQVIEDLGYTSLVTDTSS